MFTHVEIWHIGFNMLALWFLGPQLEMAIGRARFLGLYLLSGLAGSTLVLWAAPEFQATLGASGAIFGLMGALLVMAHKVGGNVQQIGMWLLLNLVITFTFPNISWQGHLGGFVGGALVAIVLAYSPRERRGTWLVLNVVITFTFPNISWQGHLGGFVGGALVAATLVYAPRARRRAWQVAGLALIGVVIVVSIAVRAVMLAA
jgi:membrane associated rhomboid family serine protease